jgi:transposase
LIYGVKEDKVRGMETYSQDLRERVIAAIEAGEQSQPQIASRFGVSLSTVEKWARRWRETGNVSATQYQPGPSRELAKCDAFLRRAVKRQPDATLAELCEQVKNEFGIVASSSMMCRELQQLNLPRKKVTAR